MKILNKIKQSATNITKKFKNQPIPLIQISQRIYHCSYPQTTNIFTQILKKQIPQQIQIWNLSEYKYPKNIYEDLQKLNFNINQVTYQFYSSMPLTTSITSINKIYKFLKSSQHNYVFVHCQQNKSRSILFLAAYMYLTGKISDVATALAFVNQKLGNNSNQTVYSSQHLILRNIANFHRDPSFINKQQLKLLKIIINQAPKIPQIQTQDKPLHILLQIRKNANIIYKKLIKHQGQGTFLQFKFKQQNIILNDDCLFSFKYVFNQKIYPVMRIQMNTNFVFNCFFRVQMQQIDLCKNIQSKGHVFTDFLFTTVQDTQSQLSKLIDKGIINQVKKVQNKRQSRSPINKKVPKIIDLLPKKIQQDLNNQFSFHDQDKQKQQLDQLSTQQKINRLLDSMAKNQAEADQHLEQQQHAQLKNLAQNQQNKQQKPVEKQQKVNQKKQNKKEIVQEARQNSEGDEQVDMDDYLNKLEQQAS